MHVVIVVCLGKLRCEYMFVCLLCVCFCAFYPVRGKEGGNMQQKNAQHFIHNVPCVLGCVA